MSHSAISWTNLLSLGTASSCCPLLVLCRFPDASRPAIASTRIADQCRKFLKPSFERHNASANTGWSVEGGSCQSGDVHSWLRSRRIVIEINGTATVPFLKWQPVRAALMCDGSPGCIWPDFALILHRFITPGHLNTPHRLVATLLKTTPQSIVYVKAVRSVDQICRHESDRSRA